MTAKQTPISIRPAREDDCSRVAEIGARAWKAIYDGYRAQLGPELFDTFYPEAIRHKCCSLREEMQALPFFVAEVDGCVVAFAACRISGTEGELMDNAVDQGYTGRGIRSSLHRYVLNYLRMHGCTCAVVRTGLDAAHAPARRAYEKNGFVRSLSSVKYFRKL